MAGALLPQVPPGSHRPTRERGAVPFMGQAQVSACVDRPGTALLPPPPQVSLGFSRAQRRSGEFSRACERVRKGS